MKNRLKRLWNAAVRTRKFMRRRMPTNILIDRMRSTRRGLRWGLPAMLLGGVYIFAAAMCITLIEHGWHETLYLLFFLLLWNGLKFIINGPICLAMLLRLRAHQTRARRRTLRAQEV